MNSKYDINRQKGETEKSERNWKESIVKKSEEEYSTTKISDYFLLYCSLGVLYNQVKFSLSEATTGEAT